MADITYVATGEGFLYLAFILDVYSRRIVGWAMESHLRTEIVCGYSPDGAMEEDARSRPGSSFRPGAQMLNEEGYRPPKRRERFGAQGIGNLMRRLGLTKEKGLRPKAQDELLSKDEWWLARLALELGMPKVTSLLKFALLGSRKGRRPTK